MEGADRTGEAAVHRRGGTIAKTPLARVSRLQVSAEEEASYHLKVGVAV